MDNNLLEQYKAKELELMKQLEEEKAKNERLQLEMTYKDKFTGLWNRKYIDKIVAEKIIDVTNPNFALVCTGIHNLEVVNRQEGESAGDALLKRIADGIQRVYGPEAICCKLVGTKMCVFLIASAEELKKKNEEYSQFIKEIMQNNGSISISYGFSQLSESDEKEVAALLKKAEYGMLMHAVSNESSDDAQVMPIHRSGKEATILMIDDSMVTLKTLQMILKDEYKVLMSTSGMEGYEIAKDKHPDLILLDYNMPVVDGEQIMHLLKKSHSTQNIPVVFVTSVSEKEKILKVAEHKPAGYLLKPVAKDNLLWVIKNLLGQ